MLEGSATCPESTSVSKHVALFFFSGSKSRQLSPRARNKPCGGRRRERYTVLRCVEGVRRRNPFVL